MSAAPDRRPVTDGIEVALGNLVARARQSNLARARDLAAALEAAGAGLLSERQRRRAVEVAHQIVGSAGTFGYPRASSLAAELEQLLARGRLHDPQHRVEADRRLAALTNELGGEPAGYWESEPGE